MTRVTVLSRQGADSFAADDVERLTRAADVRFVTLDQAPSPRQATLLLRGTDILAATNKCLPVLDEPLFDALPRMRAVVLYATGYDHIDVDMLARRGVGLCVLPEYATVAVAEHAVSMLFALATRVHLAHDRSRGLVDADTSLRGVELAGRTLGVVGVGRIGTHVARLARGIGMSVVGTDIDPAAVTSATAAGVRMTDLDELLATSHAVAVCASHTHGAPALLGGAELARMRRDALLVNVSRAALVDSAAAASAVRSGTLRGYAVDDVVLNAAVHGDLLAEGRVLQTGHSAWWRDEVLERGRRMWADHLLAAITGHPRDAVTWPDASGGSAAVLPLQPVERPVATAVS